MSNIIFVIQILASILLGDKISADGPDIYTIMNPDGIDLMLLPSKKSKTVKHLNYGDNVWSTWGYTISYSIGKAEYVKDTINGTEGYWIDIYLDNDEQGGIDGYIFSPYLYYGDFVNEADNELVLEYEGNHYSKTSYHPDLNWYGFYQIRDQFILKKIDINLILSTIDTSYRSDEFYFKSDIYNHDSRSVILSTEDSIVAEYFIGSKSTIKTGYIETLFSNFEVGHFGDNNENFLYPKQSREYNFNDKKYFLEASEQKSQKNNSDTSMIYNLKLKITDIQKKLETVKITHLGIYGDTMEHSSYKSPSLNWVGDLNLDGILDFEFKTNSMEDKCGGFVRRNIYLSKIGDTIEYSKALIVQKNYQS